MKKTEDQADNVAIAALRQISEAKFRHKNENLIELGIWNLPPPTIRYRPYQGFGRA